MCSTCELRELPPPATRHPRKIPAVTTMGSDRANPGALNPNRPNGGPKAQAIEQKHQAGRPLICYNIVF